MTKSELIEAVALSSNMTKSRAELVVNCVFDAMTGALERGEGIEIRGYGSFTVRRYDAYEGRNPRTGKAVSVPEKRLRRIFQYRCPMVDGPRGNGVVHVPV